VAKKDGEKNKDLARAYDGLKEAIRRASEKEILRFNQAVEANSPKRTIPSPRIEPKV